MLLEILNETLEFPNRREAVPEIMQTAEHKLNLAGLYYSHCIVDGKEFYDELESYLLDNVNSIEQISIIGRTLKELADEVLLSASDYLTRAVPAVEELVEAFYKGHDAECWHQLVQLAEGVQWLVESFSLIDQEMNSHPQSQCYPQWGEYLHNIHGLKETMGEITKAMVDKDLVLIGDLLNYEVTDIFKQMQANLHNMLPWEE